MTLRDDQRVESSHIAKVHRANLLLGTIGKTTVAHSYHALVSRSQIVGSFFFEVESAYPD